MFAARIAAATLPIAALVSAFAACVSDTDPAVARAPDGGWPVEAGVDAAGEGGPKPKPPGRPSPVACSNAARPPSTDADLDGGRTVAAGATYDCARDSDCTMDATGRCREMLSKGPFDAGASLGTRCTYHACFSDSDCDAGVCGCALGFAGQHVCLTLSNCRVNADCPAGEVCALSQSVNIPAVVTGAEVFDGQGVGDEVLGYFCSTPDDLCPAGELVDAAGHGTIECVYGGKTWGGSYRH